MKTYTQLLRENEELRAQLEKRTDPEKVRAAVRCLGASLSPILGADVAYDPPEIDEVRKDFAELAELVASL